MMSIRSVASMAFVATAMAIPSSSAMAQGMGPYGPNVNPYSWSDPGQAAYGGYGAYGGHGYPPGTGAGAALDWATPYNPAWSGRARRSRSTRKTTLPGRTTPEIQAGDRRGSTGPNAPYTAYDPPRPGVVPPEVRNRVRQTSPTAPHLNPWMQQLRGDDMPRLQGSDSRLTAESRQLPTGMATLNAGIAELRGGMPQLGGGMPQLGGGMATLNAGVPQIGPGMPYLNPGMANLDAMTPHLGNGMPMLGNGMPQLGFADPRLNATIPPLGTGLPIFGAAMTRPTAPPTR